MDSLGNKKLALLYILQLLQHHSDLDHPMTQGELATKLETEYGVVLERKAISRNLSLLREAGYEIESTPKGVYLDERVFDNTELRVIIDGILAGRYLTGKQAKDMCERVAALSNKHFRSHVRHVHVLAEHEKTANNTVFYAVELVDEAIENHLKISFDHYGFDERLQLVKEDRITVSPVQMVMKNGWYYLLAVTERDGRETVACYRLDRISNPILEDERATTDEATLVARGQTLDVKTLLDTHPYMHAFDHAPKDATFVCYRQDLDAVAEAFGTNVRIMPVPSHAPNGEPDPLIGLVQVRVKVDLNELIEFACRYPQRVFLQSPASAVAYQQRLYEGHLRIAEMMKTESAN